MLRSLNQIKVIKNIISIYSRLLMLQNNFRVCLYQYDSSKTYCYSISKGDADITSYIIWLISWISIMMIYQKIRINIPSVIGQLTTAYTH